MKFTAVLLTMLFTNFAFAGFGGYNGATNLGTFMSVKCSTGLTCSKVGDKLQIVAAQTLTSDLTVGGTTPYVTLGDNGAEDSGLVWDGATADWNMSYDHSVSGNLVIGLGTAGGTTNRLSFQPGSLNILMGDASEADVSLVFDGNAQNFHVGLDDSTDDLVIGLGTAPGTTDALRIDENQDVTVVQDFISLGGSANKMYGFRQDQVASTTTSITAAQCGKSFVNDSADVMTLPEASTVLGCRYTFVCANASNFDINPADGTDQIGRVSNEGTVITPSAGDAIRCAAVGASVVLEAVGADLWAPVGGANGTWTDVN